MVFYQCFGRSHTSVVAAEIHLGRLPVDRVPSVAQIMALPLFDRAGEDDLGRPLFIGRDEEGHEVFILGLDAAVREGLGAIHGLFRLAGREAPLVVDTLAGLGLTGRIGGALSRRLGLVAAGRPLAAYGVRRIYPRLVETVLAVRRFLREASS